MISMAAVRARGTTLLEVHNRGARGLRFRFHRTIARIEKRFGKSTAERWVTTLTQYQRHINMHALESAIASGNLQQVVATVDAHALQETLRRTLQDPLLQATRAGGAAASGALHAHGFDATFNAVHPNVVHYARTRSATLVTSVPEDVREVIRLVIAYGSSGRATVVQQARMIRQVIGLPRNWALAPLRFGDELRRAAADGRIGTLGRRLSGADMARVRAAIEGGTATPEFIQEMQAVYTQRLINLRAETIARTESLAAANFGVHEAWIQAAAQGELPREVKRFWIVTPDDRLCPTCSAIPGMNPDGVGLNEPFQTPEGPVDDPPAPHPNCRCATGLVFPEAA